MAKVEQPWSRSVPEGPWDAIVIGSGIGGMSAAALLARVGRRVLVLEQHDAPGGFTHTFRRGGKRTGFTWDVGVHAVGEVTEHTLSGRILADMARGQLPWVSLGPVYDAFEFPDDFRIDFPDSAAQFRANLAAAFPDGVHAVDRYLALCKEAGAAMRGYYLARTTPRGIGDLLEPVVARKANALLGRTADEVLRGLTDDPRLRTVLMAQWGYHGAPPSQASFAMQALVTRHFLHGAYYPRGGSGQIARALLQTVADAGGATALTQSVQRILLHGGRAVGVRLSDGTEVRAPLVVSAIGVAATADRLLPEHREARWAQAIRALPPGPAHLCLYLGFRGDVAAAGAGAANRWFYETWDSEVDGWDVTPEQADVGRPPVLYCSFPSLKDPDHDTGAAQSHTGEVVTFVPWRAFERWAGTGWKDRPDDYEAFKQRLHDAMLEHFFERMPALRPLLHFAELSTPLSTDHFVRPQRGSIYGLLPTPERFANPDLRPRSSIPGLIYAGSEVTSVGVVGAMMGGVLAAVAAAPWDVGRHVRSLI